MEWGQWATLVFAGVGAAGAVAQGYFALMRHRRETTQSMRDEAARWSLRSVRKGDYLSGGDAVGWRALQLVRIDGGPAVRLLELRLLKPRFVRLCPWGYKPHPDRNGPSLALPLKAQAARRLALDTDFAAERRPVDRSSVTAAVMGDWVSTGRAAHNLFAELPSLSFWRKSVRFEVRVIAEEISSTRRKISTVVRSEQIELTAETPATTR